MKIEVTLVATFCNHPPLGCGPFSCHVKMNPGSTVQHLLEECNLPEDIAKIVLINGVHARSQDVLQEGDIVSVFPPVAWG